DFHVTGVQTCALPISNSQSRAIEEALRRANIKYKVVGGLSFYQRKEIKDLLAYLRYAINQQDEASFRRIINLPKRGIGNTTIDRSEERRVGKECRATR